MNEEWGMWRELRLLPYLKLRLGQTSEKDSCYQFLFQFPFSCSDKKQNKNIFIKSNLGKERIYLAEMFIFEESQGRDRSKILRQKPWRTAICQLACWLILENWLSYIDQGHGTINNGLDHVTSISNQDNTPQTGLQVILFWAISQLSFLSQ